MTGVSEKSIIAGQIEAHSTCGNCGAPLAATQAYCGICGPQRISRRLALRDIGRDLFHAFVHVDRSVLSLVRQLLLRPGTVALDYIEGRRRRHFGPFSFLVVCVALGSAAIALSGYPVATTNQPNRVAAFLQMHPNFVYFIQVPVLAAAARLVCMFDDVRYAEHLVMVSYTQGMHVLWNSLVVVPGWYLIAPGAELSRILFFADLPVWPLYFALASSQFVPGRRWVGALKGVAAIGLAYGAVQLLTDAVTSIFAR